MGILKDYLRMLWTGKGIKWITFIVGLEGD